MHVCNKNSGGEFSVRNFFACFRFKGYNRGIFLDTRKMMNEGKTLGMLYKILFSQFKKVKVDLRK